MSGTKNVVDKDQLDIKRRQMIDSFIQVGQAMRTCADTVQAFADASALANPTDLSALLQMLAAGQSLSSHTRGGDDDDSKKKRKRSLKDPNAPKRPVTAYLQFQNEVKNEVQDLHRDKSYKDILRLVAEKWKGLDDEVKQMYTDRHKRDMLVYEQRVQAYKNAIAEGRIPNMPATAFADYKEDDEDEDDEVASQVVGDNAESDESDDSDNEPKAPSPPPAKKLKPSSKSKKSADEVPSSTPAGAEKRKSKKKASE